jgi:hypothetical protein
VKLAGLLAAALAEPTLARIRDLAAGRGGPAGRDGAGLLDLTAPPALRPFVVATTTPTRPTSPWPGTSTRSLWDASQA